MYSLEEARRLILKEASVLGPELRPLLAANGAVLSADIVSDIDIPPFDNSAMDGYAVRASEIAGASDEAVSLKVTDEVPAGHFSGKAVEAGCAARILTGAAMPPGADAVVPVEETEEPDDDTVRILKPFPAGANIRLAGEDIAKGTVVLPSGAAVGPAEIGVLSSLGYAEVPVVRMPRVAVISTGDELVEPGQPLGPGQIRNSNSYTLAAQIGSAGGCPMPLGIARDDREEIRKRIAAGAECDLLVTTGGVSVGKFDFVRSCLEELGADMMFWKIKMKPGKPLTFGRLGSALVFGVPGNPVASMVAFEEFIRPVIRKMAGHADLFRPVVRARLAEDVRKKPDRLHLDRCVLRRDGEGWTASRTGPQGSGIQLSMVLADGLMVLPAGETDFPAGSEVDVQVIKPERLFAD